MALGLGVGVSVFQIWTFLRQPAKEHSLFCSQVNLNFSLSVSWVRTCYPHLNRGP